MSGFMFFQVPKQNSLCNKLAESRWTTLQSIIEHGKTVDGRKFPPAKLLKFKHVERQSTTDQKELPDTFNMS